MSTAEKVEPKSRQEGRSQLSPKAANLRSGAIVAAVGLLATLALYLWILRLQSQGRSPAALAMPDMGMEDMGKYWSFPILQASGLTGLLFAYFGVLLGLQQSSRGTASGPFSYRTIDRLHRHVALLVVGLVIVHVIANLLNAMGTTWKTVLIPGAVADLDWPEAVLGYNLGILALYTLILLGPTYYLRKAIGLRTWRIIHRFVLVFYGSAVWHALILGLDVSYYSWIRPLMWLVQIPLLLLLVRRLRQPLRTDVQRSPAQRAALNVMRYGMVAVSVLGALVILGIVLSGNSDFIATV